MTLLPGATAARARHGQVTPSVAEDVDDVVEALGTLLGYEAAILLDPAHSLTTAIRRWPGSGADVPAGLADRLVEVAAQTWRERRTTWRAVGPGSGRCLAVPVTRGEDPIAVLVLHGASLRRADAAIEPLLQVVAGIVAGSLGCESAPAPDPAGNVSVGEDPQAPERAMALVDVFAFTVCVDRDCVEWRYFGPNSATVFGRPLSRSQALPDLLRDHADPRDASTADAFASAVAHGMRAEVELRVCGDDGETRWVSLRAVPRKVGDQLLVDGVATDVSARHSLGRSRRELDEARRLYSQEVDLRREHARAVRDANDNVLQRLFATGLRLQTLQRRLGETEAHAASAIAFQLDQAVSDLRQVVLSLNGVVEMLPDSRHPDA